MGEEAALQASPDQAVANGALDVVVLRRKMTGIDPSAGYGYAPQQDSDTGQGALVINWIGAVSSLALVVGLAVWGWQTIQRDVTGIPVIKAISEPMRVRPEDPGGLQAEHQGLSVNEVQAQGHAADAPNQVVLAPPALDLAPTNVDTTLLAPQSQTNGSRAAITPLTPDMTPEQQKAALDAMAAALAAGAPQLSTPAPLAEPEAERLAAVVAPNVPGVRVSPRPVARPASLRRTQPVVAPTTVAPTATAPQAGLPSIFVDPATISAGTRMVQFGAFDSPEIAQQEWARLSQRFARFLGDKSPVIQRAISGGREFHRLRVMSFANVGDARGFCSVFLAESTPCIPVIAK